MTTRRNESLATHVIGGALEGTAVAGRGMLLAGGAAKAGFSGYRVNLDRNLATSIRVQSSPGIMQQRSAVFMSPVRFAYEAALNSGCGVLDGDGYEPSES